MQAKEKSVPASEEQNADCADRVDVEAIMGRIRAQVKQGLAGGKSRLPKYAPPAAQLMEGAVTPVLYSEELNYLNANWNTWTIPEEITSHRRLIGPLIVRAKKAFRDFLWNGIFRKYFDAERQFQMQLVRHLNATARYIDARDAELFWQIMRKLDNDVEAMNERMDLLFDQAAASVVALESTQGLKLNELWEGKVKSGEQADQLLRDLTRHQQAIASLATDMERIKEFQLGLMTKSERAEAKERGVISGNVWGTISRGVEERIKTRCAEHAERFVGSPAVVVDLGCGDGTFLGALKGKGIDGFGVAFSAGVFEICREQGVGVVLSDAESYLRQLADQSIGGLFFFGALRGSVMIDLNTLLALAASKVKIGGKVVLDSGMPQLNVSGIEEQGCLRFPAPEELEAMVERRGFKVLDRVCTPPANASGQLAPVDVEDYMPPQWRKILDTINRNINQLNGCLFGYDYYILGEKV
jgi:hypothetical protein